MKKQSAKEILQGMKDNMQDSEQAFNDIKERITERVMGHGQVPESLRAEAMGASVAIALAETLLETWNGE